jgi:hypothetical protein
MNNKSQYIKLFSQQSDGFMDLANEIFPTDVDIKYGINACITLRKLNPRMLLDYWMTYIYITNIEEINNNDISWITDINKYAFLSDIKGGKKGQDIMRRLKPSVLALDENKKQQIADFCLKLSKITVLYFTK